MRSIVDRWRESRTRNRLGHVAARVVTWVHDIRFADPAQRAAIDHVYDDLRNMDDRIQRYMSASEQVRHQVRRELQQRIERTRPGNTSPAVIATLTILGTAITLLLTYVLGLLNGWFVLAAAATDPSTGQTNGINQSQVTTLLGGTGNVVLLAGIGLAFVSWIVVSTARDRDRLRATHLVWLDTYTDVEVTLKRSKRSIQSWLHARMIRTQPGAPPSGPMR
ncbi:hypothetical protein OSC27_14175 [Microbacterium sp. STN6]|uniref:hypothetical protein n=1 Tax=Microbacterium sp. STN6 TaxID=2995588 RepID=UPI0022610260|nr:hypothetical protein [Microbacterium sp. STN6]MCX7523418.1 hypothetical protein [Microbacterium sp. STN6]